MAQNDIPCIVADEAHFPNGTATTADILTLFVAETLAVALTAFDICEEGSQGQP